MTIPASSNQVAGTLPHTTAAFGAEWMPDGYGWQSYALCAEVDPELFFPEKGVSAATARKICFACPVRTECLDWAISNGETSGVWGGLSERERRGLMPMEVAA